MSDAIFAPSGAPAAPEAPQGAPEQRTSAPPADTGADPSPNTHDAPPENTTPDSGETAKPAQERIDELTFHRRRAERIAAQLIEENQRLQDAMRQSAPGFAPGQQSQPGPQGFNPAQVVNVTGEAQPDASKYDDWGAYTRDMAAWATRQEIARSQMSAQEQQRAQQQHQQQLMQQHAHRVREATLATHFEAGKAQYPDFERAVTSPALPSFREVHPSIMDAVVYSDQAVPLIYHLATNPKEAHRLVALHPVAAIREIGKLEAKLATSSVPTSGAPAPVPNLGGRAGGVDPLSDRSSIETWMRARNELEARKRKR